VIHNDTRSTKRQKERHGLGDVENDLKKMGVSGCRKIATDRDSWKLTLKEAEGPSWVI
jgi:hypothetical protein